MTSRRCLIAMGLTVLLAVAACTQSGGAGTGGASEPTAVGGTSAAPSVESASAAAATPAASAAASTAASAAPASAPVEATDPCKFITAEEATDILGFDVKSTAQIDGMICIYEVPATGAIAAVTQLSTVDAAAAFETLKSAPDATPVEGLGDDALWQPAYLAAKLYILKGDDVVMIAVGTLSGVPIDEMPPETPPQTLLDKAKKLGEIAAPRM